MSKSPNTKSSAPAPAHQSSSLRKPMLWKASSSTAVRNIQIMASPYLPLIAARLALSKLLGSLSPNPLHAMSIVKSFILKPRDKYTKAGADGCTASNAAQDHWVHKGIHYFGTPKSSATLDLANSVSDKLAKYSVSPGHRVSPQYLHLESAAAVGHQCWQIGMSNPYMASPLEGRL
jgi:hypothetical protein